MAWIKDTVSQSPRTVYEAPEDVFPIIRVIYDPDAEHKWSVVYSHLQAPTDTQASIEALIGV